MEKKKHPLLPPKASRSEYQILMLGVVNLYQKLNDPVDKFIVAFVFECGYRQTVAADILDVTDATITKRIEKIKKMLTVSYAKGDINSEECDYEPASVA